MIKEGWSTCMMNAGLRYEHDSFVLFSRQKMDAIECQIADGYDYAKPPFHDWINHESYTTGIEPILPFKNL